MKINDTKTYKSRILIITLTFLTAMMGSLYYIGMPAGASAGMMLGLKEPLSSMPLILLLAVCGLYCSNKRTFHIALFLAALMLAFGFSVAINLVAGHPALFRTVIFMCAASLLYLSSEMPVSKTPMYVFAATGYFLGMNKGITLPEIICPLYYLIGLSISMLLVFSSFALLGMALGNEVISLIQKNISSLFKDKLLGSFKKLF